VELASSERDARAKNGCTGDGSCVTTQGPLDVPFASGPSRPFPCRATTGLTPGAPELAALFVAVPPAVRKSAVRTLPGPVELTSTVPECSGENEAVS
jgi:hypothetical protein